MRSRSRNVALLCAIMLLFAAAAFAAACGDEEAVADATVTTAAVANTTAAAAPTTTAAAAGDSAAPTSGTVIIKGSVDTPMTLAAADLEKMRVTTITAEHPKLGATEYTGVLMSDLMEAAGVQASVTKVVMAAADGFMAEVTLAELDANAMLAIGEDGKLGAVMPGLTGKAWVKDVVTMQFN